MSLTCFRVRLIIVLIYLRTMELYWTWPSGFLLQQLWSRPHNWEGCDSRGAKRRHCPTPSAGTGHQNVSRTPYQGDDAQHTLRKDVAGISTRNSSSTKNIGHPTQEWMYSVPQSCLILCNPMDCSLPGSSVHGILQARILEWAAIPFSRDLSDPGIEPGSLTLQADSLASKPPGKPPYMLLPL